MNPQLFDTCVSVVEATAFRICILVQGESVCCAISIGIHVFFQLLDVESWHGLCKISLDFE